MGTTELQYQILFCSTMTEEDPKVETSLRELNARVLLLEKFVRGNGSDLLSTNQSLVDSINGIYNELSDVFKTNPQLGKFVDNCKFVMCF
jgi:hypothetical protein